MNEIVQKENKVLRKIADKVPVEAISSRKIKTIIRRMIKALDSQEDGVAIAAPQIGAPLSIFVVSGKVFEIMDGKNEEEIEKKKTKDITFINPTIVKLSREKEEVEEGCLSVRYLYGKVSRSNKAIVEAYDETGKEFTKGSTGLLAQIFQHETDHLNGILFIDKAKSLEEIPPVQKHGQTRAK